MRLDEAMQAQAAGAQRSDATGKRTVADPQAWRREMERTQAQSWFHRFDDRPESLPERSGRAAPAASVRDGRPAAAETASVVPAAASRSPFTVQPVRLSLPAVQADGGAPFPLPRPLPLSPHEQYPQRVGPGATAAPAVQPTVPSAPALPAVDAPFPGIDAAILDLERPGQAGAATERGPTATSPDETGAASSLPARAAKGDGAKVPVRVHVEGDAQRATVWLGVDAAADLDMTSLTRAIGRWLASAGYGTPIWICNGRTLELAHEPAGIDSSVDEAPARTLAQHTHLIDQPHGESA